ncbi:hypothetical protein C8R47DRAFT_987629 [Mycena vitilis]|nr:hypothetical protein C8R47DRAFT_987629 [Mycena vitilis]
MEPASKRQRTESDTRPASLSVTRSKIWYSDGSVVLQVEMTQFRVHASILSSSSNVFRDMFEVGRAPDNLDGQVEGCPLVRLYGDQAVEFEMVLDALYDRTFYKEQAKPFALVAAMLRLGKKYEFDQLREDAVTRLERSFPLSLEHFRERKERAQIVPYDGLTYDAVNLARETGLLSILPAALYCASAHSSEIADVHRAILQGLPGADGAPVHLNSDDKAVCILAMSPLLTQERKEPYSWLEPTAKPAFPHPRCRLASDIIRDVLFSGVPTFAQIGQAAVFRTLFCPECSVVVDTHISEGEAKLWAQLPGIFGLPSWEDIQKQG